MEEALQNVLLYYQRGLVSICYKNFQMSTNYSMMLNTCSIERTHFTCKVSLTFKIILLKEPINVHTVRSIL